MCKIRRCSKGTFPCHHHQDSPVIPQTDSKYTLMVSGTGHAGMEACISNLVEPGDKVVVGNAGIWGERVAEMSRRFRGELRGRRGLQMG